MDVYERFWEHFEFVLAATPADKAQVYTLRYRVYTGEFGHEMPGEPENELEYDEFDSRSLHCLIRHRTSRETAACIRVVFPGIERDAAEALPIESNAKGYLFHSEFVPEKLSRSSICEVSRAAILGRYRKRAGSAAPGPSTFPSSDEDFKITALLGGAVYLASTAMIELAGRRHAFALMEPRLARLLGRFDLSFLRIGELQAFNGVRAGYYIDQNRAREALKPALQAFYRRISQTLAAQFEASDSDFRAHAPGGKPGSVSLDRETRSSAKRDTRTPEMTEDVSRYGCPGNASS